MLEISLEDICKEVDGETAEGVDVSFLRKIPKGVSIDSRTSKEGEIFFAIKGNRFDGHDFIADAFKKDACGVVASRSWVDANRSKIGDRFIIGVADTISALGLLGKSCRKRFSIPTVAVTGTAGKTTTKEMTADVLSSKYRVLKTQGNLNTKIGLPLTIFNLSDEHEVAVLELGATEPGGITNLCRIADPNIGMITNIGPAHLEFFGSLENVVATKWELLEYLDKSSTAILNFDDDILDKERDAIKGRLLGFSIERESHFRCRELRFDRNGCAQFSLLGTQIGLALPGKHSVYNALAAAAVGDYFGLDMGTIKMALENCRPSPMRMKLIHKKGVKVIDDAYNSNPLSCKAALDTLSRMEVGVGGRRIAVLGDMLEMGERGPDLHREVGRYAGLSKIDRLLALGPLSLEMCVGTLEEGMSKENVQHFEVKEALSLYLKNILKKGDVVLIKGSRGMKMEEIVEELDL